MAEAANSLAFSSPFACGIPRPQGSALLISRKTREERQQRESNLIATSGRDFLISQEYCADDTEAMMCTKFLCANYQHDEHMLHTIASAPTGH
jgi:hypothetical protein